MIGRLWSSSRHLRVTLAVAPVLLTHAITVVIVPEPVLLKTLYYLCIFSMIQEGKNETKQRDPSTKLFVIGCTHRPFEVSFEVRDCFSAKLFASSTKPSKYANHHVAMLPKFHFVVPIHNCDFWRVSRLRACHDDILDDMIDVIDVSTECMRCACRPADDLHKQLRFATLDGWFERSTSTRRSRRKPQSAQASSVAAGRQTLQVHRVAGAADFSNHNRHADMISLPQSGSNSPRAAASSSNARRTASTRRSEDSEDVEVEVDTDPKPRSRVITHSGSAATGKPGITTHSAASSESTSITSTQSLRSPASKSVTKSDQQASPRGEAAQPTHLRTIAV